MVSVTPDLADAGDALDCQRDPDRKTPNAFRQLEMIIGLDDCVQVVLLNGEMQHAKCPITGPGDALADG